MLNKNFITYQVPATKNAALTMLVQHAGDCTFLLGMDLFWNYSKVGENKSSRFNFKNKIQIAI